MEQASGSIMRGIHAFPACLPLTSLLWSSNAFRLFVSTTFRLIPVSRSFWIMLKISTMVVLSVPFNPNPMPLSLSLAILYLTHPAVTKVTRSVKYKHSPNIWHGKKVPMDLL